LLLIRVEIEAPYHDKKLHPLHQKANSYKLITMTTLETPIEEIPRAMGLLVPKLKHLGIEIVRDLLYHFPVRYQDFSTITPIRDVEPGENVVIQGVIQEIKTIRTPRRGMFLVQAAIEDETGGIEIVWFNQIYIRRQLPIGTRVNLAGKVMIKGTRMYLTSPMYEVVSEDGETTHTGRVVGIYPETRGITSKGIRYFLDRALNDLAPVEEYLPQAMLEKNDFPEIDTALRTVHFPASIEEGEHAQKRFDFEDLFFLQLYNLQEKLKLQETKATKITIEVDEIKKLLTTLPFELTPSQKQSLWEIIQEIGKGHPMNRLLQGDVGSGKTIVVALAAILAAEHGHQVVMMAPTEILARQHYKNLTRFFPRFEQGIALLTANETRVNYGNNLENDVKKKALTEEISAGKAKIIIGTHAVIQKNVEFKNLALVIIDEQHRFGVRQRAKLLQEQKIAPHLLSMSATPIPRTLNLTLFGDLDLSLITELPKNRKPIVTNVVDPKDRQQAYAFIRDQIKQGRQTFVVCPRIEEESSDEAEKAQQSSWNAFQKLEIKSIKKEYEKLSKTIFPDLTIEMLHGKMKPKEKEDIMERFSEGSINILVSTSVIEVGIDIPNASVMMVEGAERFGLAQLYQFRGRVGRGEHESYCLLFTDAHSKTTHNRLKSIAEAKNGLELAERDLKLRGPGEFLGDIQTGMPDLAMKALKYPHLVKSARDAAQEILTQDRTLKNHPKLKAHLTQFQSQVHWE